MFGVKIFILLLVVFVLFNALFCSYLKANPDEFMSWKYGTKYDKLATFLGIWLFILVALVLYSVVYLLFFY